MNLFLQELFNGIVLGTEYALFAVGLVLIFGVLRVMNFAHGALFAWGGVGAVLAFGLVHGQPVVVSVLAGIIVGAGIALVMQVAIIDVLNAKKVSGHLAPAVATVGGAWVLVGLGGVVLGPNPRPFPDGVLKTTFHHVFLIDISVMQLGVLATAVIALVALDIVVFRTRLGRSIRAVAFEPDNAELLGIDVRLIRTSAFVISGALAGLAGALTTLTLDLASPYLSEGILVKGFAIIVLGGMGSVRGAILGALLLGVVEVATVAVGLSAYRDAAPALLLFVVLMLKPAGLFGRREVQRA